MSDPGGGSTLYIAHTCWLLVVNLTFSVLVFYSKTPFYTAVVNLARGLLNRGKWNRNTKLGSAPSHVILTEEKNEKTLGEYNKDNEKNKGPEGNHHVTHLHACLGAMQVSVHLPPVHVSFDSLTKPIGVACRFYGYVYDDDFPSLVASLF